MSGKRYTEEITRGRKGGKDAKNGIFYRGLRGER